MSNVDEGTLKRYVEEFRKLPTGNISDAMDELGLELLLSRLLRSRGL